jgi:hypothetical protein
LVTNIKRRTTTKATHRQNLITAALVGALRAVITHAETVETLALSAGIPAT